MGGEALPPVLAARFGQRLPNAHLHNAYGPTETTVDATGKPAAIFTPWPISFDHVAVNETCATPTSRCVCVKSPAVMQGLLCRL